MNSIRIEDVTAFLEGWAPGSYAENYDNVGLLVGRHHNPVSRVLVSLDVTEAVVDEAIKRNCELIISHHPLIFGGLKRLTGQDYVARTVEKAILNGINLLAIHTNLDNVKSGVNHKMAEVLGLEETRILRPVKGNLLKLTWFTPENRHLEVLSKVHQAGAGQIGDYSHCSFSSPGVGRFLPEVGSNPRLGEVGKAEEVNEIKAEVIIPENLQIPILNALFQAHPYEEVAYFLTRLENQWQEIGSGMVGIFEDEMDWPSFSQLLKDKFNLSTFRHTKAGFSKIKKVALCGGSGFFLLGDALKAKADVFLTSDIKYHQFFDADDKVVLVDLGHFESEQFTSYLILEKLSNHFPNIAVLLSEVRTNPVFYA